MSFIPKTGHNLKVIGLRKWFLQNLQFRNYSPAIVMTNPIEKNLVEWLLPSEYPKWQSQIQTAVVHGRADDPRDPPEPPEAV